MAVSQERKISDPVRSYVMSVTTPMRLEETLRKRAIEEAVERSATGGAGGGLEVDIAAPEGRGLEVKKGRYGTEVTGDRR